MRLGVLERCAAVPVSDRAGLLLSPLLAALQSDLPDQIRAAASAIFATYSGQDAERLAATTTQLLPNRYALSELVQTLRVHLHTARGSLLPTVRAVLAALAADPLTSALQVELVVAGLPWDDVAAFLTRLADGPLLHADTLAAAVAALALAGTRTGSASVVRLDTLLGQVADERLRRLGLAALLASAERDGWSAGHLERLTAYRADPAPLVASAAQFTFPPSLTP